MNQFPNVFRSRLRRTYCIAALFIVTWLVSGVPLQAQIELPEDVTAAEKQRIETIAKVSPAVVAIFPPSGKGGGSGVLISSDGLALTNFHVVTGAGPFVKCGLNDGNVYDAAVMGIDPTGDVAMIRLLGREDFPFVPLGDSDTVQVGDWTFAMGNPFLLADDFTPTLTYGMVSGVQRYQYPAGTILEYTDCIQVDTSINPGNSGGPLFNSDGELIGINGRISVEKRGRVNAGAGYAISINQIKNFRDHLQSGRVVDHATLGATVRTDQFSNVSVETILPTCSAFFHGLRADDELVSFGGRPIGSVNQFKNVLGIYPKGWKIPLVYRRDGERDEIYPRLEALHSIGELISYSNSPNPPKPEKEREKPESPEERPKLEQVLKKPGYVIPDEYKDLYEERIGFVNYHFNRIKQEELIESVAALGTSEGTQQKWTLTGEVTGRGPYKIVLTEFAGLLQLSAENTTALLDRGRPETHLAGLNTEGMLMSLFELFNFMTAGDENFAETIYIGSEPLDGKGPRVDVLETLHENRKIRWYFDQQSSQLVGWDTFITEFFPACGLRVGSWETDGEFARPKQITLVMPAQDPVTFRVDELIVDQVEKPEF